MKNEIISILEELSPILKKYDTPEKLKNSAAASEKIAQLRSYYGKVQNLIIVRLDAIGDSLMFTNSVREIRNLFPNAQITYVCYKETREIIERCPYINTPVYIDRAQLSNNKFYREQIYSALQKYEFDLLINPLFSREFLAEEIVCFINAAIKIGINGDLSNIDPILLNVTNNWYDLMLNTDTVHNKFELFRNAEIIRLLGGDSDENALPELWTDKRDADFIGKFISEYDLGEYAVVFPGTKGGKNSIKYWGTEKYAQLIDFIQQNSGLKVVVLGGTDEEEICSEINSACVTQPIVLHGHFSIWKSAELLKRAKFYIGSDTSMAHFSSAFEIPTVVLLGGGHFGRFFPYPGHKNVIAVYDKLECYNCNWKCTQPYNKCIKDISVEKIKKVLKENGLLGTADGKVKQKHQPAAVNLISQRGSQPKIDLLLPPSSGHSWHLKEAWVMNLKAQGLLNRAFSFTSEHYKYFFDYLKKGPNSDIIFALGGDHHLHFLHDTEQKIDNWKKCRTTKVCYSYESTLDSQYPFYETRSNNASKVFTHFLTADENDVKFFSRKGRDAAWFPQFVDEKFFANSTEFSERKNKLFFKGKLWSEYKERQDIIKKLNDARLIDVVEEFLTNSQLVDKYNSYKSVINPPGVFGGFNVRTFEALACGNLLFQFLPDNRPLNNALFRNGEHLIYFDPANPGSLAAGINDFLSNPDYYAAVASNGYEEVLEHHTLNKRLDALLDWVQHNKKPEFPQYSGVPENSGDEKTVSPRVSINKKRESGVKVSAIVSVYNSEKYIEGCLKNLVTQTLYEKGELEIVLVNTGSEQNEDRVINKYLNEYSNIKYIKTEERETIYSAWNRGIQAATGIYVTNANTDDRHREDSLETMYAAFCANPEIDVVYSNQYVTKTANDSFNSKSKKTEQNWGGYDPDLLLFGCFIGPQPMWKKSLHEKFGYFNSGLKVVGDFEFWLRISREARFSHIKDFLGLYYYTDTSAEHRNQELTDKENSDVQNYYLGKYVKSESDILRIRNKVESLKNSPNHKAYYNFVHEMLDKRLEGMNYESSVLKALGKMNGELGAELIEILNKHLDEINSSEIPVDSDTLREVLQLKKGEVYFKLGKLENAKECFENALSINNGSSQACLGLGKIFEAGQMPNEAKTMFEWAVKNDTGNSEARVHLREVNASLGLPAEDNSLNSSNNGSEEIQDEFLEYLEKARIALTNNKFDDAQSSIEIAVELHKGSSEYSNVIASVDLLNLAGNISLANNKLEEARSYFERELSENPASSSACLGLGNVFSAAEMSEAAKTMFEWAVKNDPQNQQALQALGNVNRILGLEPDHNSIMI